MKTEEFFPTSKIYISKKMKINIVLFDHNSAGDQLKPLPECITEGVREGFNISEKAKNERWEVFIHFMWPHLSTM